MPATRNLPLLWCLILLVLAILLFPVRSGDELLFSDDFNRTDGPELANGWTEVEIGKATVGIDSGRLFFIDTSNRNLRPMVYHLFSRVSSDILTWEFDFDWSQIGSEEDYRLFMQLGDGSLMDPSSADVGVGVNLVWGWFGGGERLAYRKDGTETVLGGVSGPSHVVVSADLAFYPAGAAETCLF